MNEGTMDFQSVLRLLSIKRIGKPKDLYSRFLKEDQKLMNSNTWDYGNPGLIVNKVKNILENIDLKDISKEENYERSWILWLWYHHAISQAIHEKNQKLAQSFTEKSLQIQPKDSNNKITKLFYLVLHDKEDEAKEWAISIDNFEKEFAKKIMNSYPDWFKK